DGQLTTSDAMTVENALRAITGKPLAGDDRTREQKNADALVMLADAYAKGQVRGGRERPTVVVTIDIDVLEGRVPGAGRSSTGQIIPTEIVRQMCTNANLVRLLTSNSVPLDLGRSQRLASDAQFKALLARDGGCRFQGCQMPADWCQVDHIHEWTAQNGPTDLHLLVLWCVYDTAPTSTSTATPTTSPSHSPTAEPCHSPPADPRARPRLRERARATVVRRQLTAGDQRPRRALLRRGPGWRQHATLRRSAVASERSSGKRQGSPTRRSPLCTISQCSPRSRSISSTGCPLPRRVDPVGVVPLSGRWERARH
ncbi:MAG: hypothetical protein JWN62_3990, partial [Acidimicrobiales bacterium]|nr:hypothetical protein [Acidimicrobiales bacterium]